MDEEEKTHIPYHHSYTITLTQHRGEARPHNRLRRRGSVLGTQPPRCHSILPSSSPRSASGFGRSGFGRIFLDCSAARFTRHGTDGPPHVRAGAGVGVQSTLRRVLMDGIGIHNKGPNRTFVALLSLSPGIDFAVVDE